MANFLVILLIVMTFVSTVVSFPADHREDTVLPFSLSPGNVNLETYYLDKYPQPGVPGGPLIKKSTSQMTPSPLDPVPVPEANGNMFLIQKTKDPHAMFRTRRAAYPFPQFGTPHYPSGGHHSQGSMGFGLYNEDNLHHYEYPRHGSGLHEQDHQQHHHQTDTYTHSTHHVHQQLHHSSPEHHHHPPHHYHGRH